ncbi:hypothetical protein Poli38472_007323 [Pythium oligandrum]|uniref:FYVE-type domain-containing protein n=1 Tax=Pythium oligandrum TaxID=41045 RepID=A0A8K1CA11_PYTOL|nr:hypothetical protein Poli38472_007323 [Pythium oligandrum]|eukprot:TMW59178.1 hypothetical protein Poli38472_007323 [Pythium oligandrum]
MGLKIPTTEEMFPHLQLSIGDMEDYDLLTQMILEETIAEYEEYAYIHNRTMDSKKWKPIKTHEHLTCYKKGDRASPDDSFATASNGSSSRGSLTSTSSMSSMNSMSNTASWGTAHPKMVVAGTIVGNLEDAMFGFITPDTETVKVKTSYVDDDIAECRVLQHMRVPSKINPFRYFGLKWCVKSTPRMATMVRHRDYVYLDRTGIHVLPSGERVGFVIWHSIDHPHAGDLATLGFVRAKQSICFLLKEGAQSSIEVYARAFMDSGGNLPERVAITSAADNLIASLQVGWCAQNKKLAYMMAETAAARMRHNNSADPNAAKPKVSTSKTCTLCKKGLSLFRTLTTCELCFEQICARCLTGRKLSYVRRSGDLIQVPTGFCKTCITRASAISASDIMIIEYAATMPRLASNEQLKTPVLESKSPAQPAYQMPSRRKQSISSPAKPVMKTPRVTESEHGSRRGLTLEELTTQKEAPTLSQRGGLL